MKVLAVIAAIAAALVFAAATSARSGWYITYYCLTGTTADGHGVYIGEAAAGSEVRFGTRLYVPGGGGIPSMTVTVHDRGSAVGYHHVDVWWPNCHQAFNATHYAPVTILGR